MKNIARMALEPGMVIGADILTKSGELLIADGTKVDPNVINKLTDAFISILTLHLCIMNRFQAGTAGEDLQIVNSNEQAGISAHMNQFGKRAEHMSGVIFGDAAGVETQGP